MSAARYIGGIAYAIIAGFATGYAVEGDQSMWAAAVSFALLAIGIWLDGIAERIKKADR